MDFVEEWTKYARSDLEKADTAYNNHHYDDALYHLQQADEKAAKALLYKFGLLLGQDEKQARDTLKLVFGIEKVQPKDYSHNWHPKLLKTLGEFVSGTDDFITFMIEMGAPREQLDKFTQMFPDFRKRLEIASKVTLNPNPTPSELDSVVHDSNQILDGVASLEQKWDETLENISLPDFVTLEPMIKSIEQLMGTKVPSKEMEKIRTVYKNAKGYASRGIVTISESLILLAIYSTFLAPHEHMSRYPDEKRDFQYNEKMPLVKYYKDIRLLIAHCINTSLTQSSV